MAKLNSRWMILLDNIISTSQIKYSFPSLNCRGCVQVFVRCFAILRMLMMMTHRTSVGGPWGHHSFSYQGFLRLNLDIQYAKSSISASYNYNSILHVVKSIFYLCFSKNVRLVKHFYHVFNFLWHLFVLNAYSLNGFGFYAGILQAL